MISPQKLTEYKEPKLLPTINLTDQLSLNTWMDLRKLSIDYGRKYFYRHEIYLPFIFLVAIVSLIAAFVFLVIKIEVSEQI